MRSCSEKNFLYVIKGTFSVVERFKENNPKLFDLKIIKLFYNKLFEKSVLKSFFCSLFNEVVIIKATACRVLSKNNFAKINNFLRKTV